MDERFNGRIYDPGASPGRALLCTHHVRSSADLEQILHRYVALYN
ncbi:hypothetical protein [Immundisolibacter sp.]